MQSLEQSSQNYTERRMQQANRNSSLHGRINKRNTVYIMSKCLN